MEGNTGFGLGGAMNSSRAAGGRRGLVVLGSVVEQSRCPAAPLQGLCTIQGLSPGTASHLTPIVSSGVRHLSGSWPAGLWFEQDKMIVEQYLEMGLGASPH